MIVCFDARGFDSAGFLTLAADVFRLMGRFIAGFSPSFLTMALVTSPKAGFLRALVTSPSAARFRVPAATALLFPTFEGIAVVVVVVISVVEASFDRVTRVCCTLFSS